MDLIRPLLSMAAVFGLLGAALWWARRRGFALAPHSAPGSLRVIGRLRLSPQHTLYLVSVGDRTVLVATHPAGCSLLRETK